MDERRIDSECILDMMNTFRKLLWGAAKSRLCWCHGGRILPSFV